MMPHGHVRVLGTWASAASYLHAAFCTASVSLDQQQRAAGMSHTHAAFVAGRRAMHSAGPL